MTKVVFLIHSIKKKKKIQDFCVSQNIYKIKESMRRHVENALHARNIVNP